MSFCAPALALLDLLVLGGEESLGVVPRPESLSEGRGLCRVECNEERLGQLGMCASSMSSSSALRAGEFKRLNDFRLRRSVGWLSIVVGVDAVDVEIRSGFKSRVSSFFFSSVVLPLTSRSVEVEQPIA